MSFKIASFNVNSIKMRLPNVLSWLDKNNIDVILMQETKTIDDNFPSLDFKQKQYNVIFNGQKSYNGVAIASKYEINEITRSLPFYNESIDCYDVSKWQNDALYLETTRRHLRELINIGLVDAYRIKHPTAKEYSFWDYQGGAWQKDNGIRIDLFLISPEIVDNLIDVGIDKTPRGEEKPSDHAPIWIHLEK